MGLVTVTTLPYEILSRVFEIAHSEQAIFFDSLREEDKKAHLPTIVSHVNRHFRHVATTTATLWSQIHIKYEARTGKGSPESILPRTKLWLDRARDCPLDINIRDASSSSPENITAIINLLLPCSRWRHFCLRVISGTVARAAVRLCDSPAPVLRSFEIWYIDYHRTFPQETFNIFQGTAPRLETVRFGSLAPLPWCRCVISGLQHLEMRDFDSQSWPSLSEIMDLLSYSPLLQSLKMRGPTRAWGQRTAKWGDGGLPMHHLMHIELSRLDVDVMVSFLQVLDLPSLHSFAIDQIRVEDEEPNVEILTQYLCSERYPLLTQLYFGDVHCTDAWFERLLTRLPTIEELELNDEQGVNKSTESHCIHALIRSDREASRVGRHTAFLLPKLRCVKLCGVPRRTAFDFLDYRRPLGGTLTHVFINARDARSLFETDVEDLRELFIFRFYVHKDWIHE